MRCESLFHKGSPRLYESWGQSQRHRSLLCGQMSHAHSCFLRNKHHRHLFREWNHASRLKVLSKILAFSPRILTSIRFLVTREGRYFCIVGRCSTGTGDHYANLAPQNSALQLPFYFPRGFQMRKAEKRSVRARQRPAVKGLETSQISSVSIILGCLHLCSNTSATPRSWWQTRCPCIPRPCFVCGY